MPSHGGTVRLCIAGNQALHLKMVAAYKHTLSHSFHLLFFTLIAQKTHTWIQWASEWHHLESALLLSSAIMRRSAGLLVKLWWHFAWWLWMVYNWSLMCFLSPCQAYGMSVLPLNLIKGTRSILYERLENTEDREEVEHQIDKLKAKVSVCVNWIHIRALLTLFKMSSLSVAVLEVSSSQLVGFDPKLI